MTRPLTRRALGRRALDRRALARTALGVGAVLGAPILGSCWDDPAPPIRIAAGTEGGIYAVFAALLATELRKATPDRAVDVLHTDGSVDNLQLLADGGADVGLALEDSVGAGPGDPVALARTYENYLQVLVPADSPVRRVEDLRGRRLVLGAAGSGAAVTGGVLLRAAGVPRRELDVSHATLADGLDRVVAGTADAVVWSGGIPTPAVTRAARRRPLRMVALGRYARTMADRSGFRYAARRVPPVGYGPVPADGATIGVANLLLARPELPDASAATIVEVLATRAARLVPDYVRGLQYLAPTTMIQTGGVPLHSGARAAYRRLHG